MNTYKKPEKLTFFRRKLDPAVRVMLSNKKVRQLSIVIQSSDGTDERIKKCIKKYGGRIVEEYPFINACGAVIPPAGVKPLEALGQVRYLSLNHPVSAHLNNVRTITAAGTAHNRGLTGRNVNIALLDTGTYPHPDLIRPVNRIICFKDFVNNRQFAYDDNGHGTFTAGIMAGNGCMSKGEYAGAAPGSGLISLKVLDGSGNGWTSNVLSGMQWVYDNREKYGIKVVCLPLGCPSFMSCRDDPLSVAAQALWEAGLIVCSSAGNNGPGASWISSPGINPTIITVGALYNHGTSIFQESPLCDFSSRGFTPDGNRKPDLVAPGAAIVSLNSDMTFIPKSSADYRVARLENYYRRGSGTSAACATVAGITALLLEKHGDLTPDEVKSLLRHSCRSLNLLKEQQGSGLPDINRLLE
jgi:serine protease AprX